MRPVGHKTVTQDELASGFRNVIKQRPNSAEGSAHKSSVLELWKTHGLTSVLSDRSEFENLES